MDKEKYKFYYEAFMGCLALTVVFILVVELIRPVTEAQAIMFAQIDLAVLLIFTGDYFYRLFNARRKWAFFKDNLIDLVAILPFDKIFRVARLIRVTRLTRAAGIAHLAHVLRLTRLARVAAFSKRSGDTIAGILRTNGLAYAVGFTFLIILGGAIGIMALEPGVGSFAEGIWWSLVTTTTVGYGDILPVTAGGRILAGIMMLVGIGFIGMVTGSIATYFVGRGMEREKRTIAEEQMEYVIGKLAHLHELDRDEVDILQTIINKVWEAKRAAGK
ncbi:MAG: potassium channel family protein [bacterium]|jgi:voltage-gated potassium channel